MRKIRLIGLVAALLVVIFLVGSFKWGIFRNVSQAGEGQSSSGETSQEEYTLPEKKIEQVFASLQVQLIEPPRPVQDFTLRNLQGKKVSTEDLRGKFVWINFWATWCPPCRGEMPSMQTVWEKFGGEEFVLLAVDIRESEQTVRSFVENNNYTFPVLLDKEGQVAKSYGVRAIPSNIFVSPEGKIIGQAIGAREWENDKFYDLLREVVSSNSE